jgi:hypothetical protein
VRATDIRAGALCERGIDAARLGGDSEWVRTFVQSLREGWVAMDRLGVGRPLGLRAIFQLIPLPLSVAYWSRLLRSPRGEYYFARHTRHAVGELAMIAADVRKLLPMEGLPALSRLYAAIDAKAG